LRVSHVISVGIVAHFSPMVNEFQARECENGRVKKLARRGAVIGACIGLGYAAWRFIQTRTNVSDAVRFEPQPFPLPPRPVAVEPLERPGPSHLAPAPPTDDGVAVDPDAAGNCPMSHPIKGKLASGIYHRPGAFAYERTRADRCYRDETAAQHDGLRAAKR